MLDFVPFDDLNNVPASWRAKYLTEAGVSLEQWNDIAAYAHQNPVDSLDPESGEVVSRAPALAHAVEWFRLAHTPLHGLWVPNSGGGN